MIRFAALLLFALVLRAQTVKPGQMLVASQQSRDPDFRRTVILVVYADSHGIAGLMLNRPTDADIMRLLPDLKQPPSENKIVYAGGPLALGVNALTRSRTQPAGARMLAGGIWLLAAKSAITRELSTRPGAVRVYIGQCGWSREQMQAELSRGLWIVSLGDAAAVFDSKPETLWSRLIERLAR